MSENLLNWNEYLQVASKSDTGMRRSNNQDNLSISLASSFEQYHCKGHLFIVADGMGAHAAGELASKLAIDHIPHLYRKYDSSTAAEELQRAVVDANSEIFRKGQANEEFFNMGTTCSAMVIIPQGVMIAHVGDSRVYRLSKHRLEQLTFDHSLVWELRGGGQVDESDEFAGKIPRNVITRSLGPYPDVKVDMEGPFPIQAGDLFMLCSDGLTAVVNDAEIAAILDNCDPNEAVQILVDLANLRGGPDNTTIIVAKILHPQLAAHPNASSQRPSQAKSKMPVPPYLWAILAVAVLFAALFGFFANWLTAVLPASVAGLTAIYIVYRYLQGASSESNIVSQQRLGKGPYTATACPTGPQFANQLAEILNQLKQAAKDKDWVLDRAQLDTIIESAQASMKNKQYNDSIRGYSQAIRFLMGQLRNQQDGDPDA